MSTREKLGAAVMAVLALVLAAGWLRDEGHASPAGPAPVPGESGEVRTITGTGTGRVRGKPDTLTVDIGVDTRGGSAEEALARNNERAARAIEALEQAGVPGDDLQTSQLSISPVFDDDGERIVAYEVSNAVTATLHDLDKAGAVIDSAADAAGDDVRVNGVWFSIEDTNELVATARVDAVQRARTQAEQLATAAGVTLGAVVSIEETSAPAGPPVDVAEAEGGEDRAAPTTPIAPGSQELTVDVVVHFAIA